VLTIFRDGFPFAILRRFAWFFLATIAGVFLGTAVLVNLPLWVLNFCLGTMVLVFVAFNWLKFEFRITPGMEKLLSIPVGFISGFLNGVTNAAGPALAIYLYSLKLEKREFIKSIATIFVFMMRDGGAIWRSPASVGTDYSAGAKRLSGNPRTYSTVS
jgi:hypothetical protein